MRLGAVKYTCGCVLIEDWEEPDRWDDLQPGVQSVSVKVRTSQNLCAVHWAFQEDAIEQTHTKA